MSWYYLIPLFCTALPLIRLILDKMGQKWTFQCYQEEQWRGTEGSCDSVQVSRWQPPQGTLPRWKFSFLEHFVVTLNQFQAFLNSGSRPCELHKALTLTIVRRSSAPSSPMPCKSGLLSGQEMVPGPSAAEELLCLASCSSRLRAQRICKECSKAGNQYSARLPAHRLVGHMQRSHGNQHPSSRAILRALGGSPSLGCPSHGSQLLRANQPREQARQEEKKTQQSLVFNLSATRESKKWQGKYNSRSWGEGTLM